MKKIGIITWFRDYNYGTKLQAYALQKYLNENGYDASIINYTMHSSASISKEPNRSLYKKIYGRLSWELLKRTRIKHSSEIENRNKKMDEFTNRNCKLTEEISSKEQFVDVCNSFDLIIAGSDQIWNPDWYDPMYYADYPDINSVKIAYAPSIGTDHIREDRRKEIGHSLSGFKQIGMRETKGCELLQSIYGIQAKKVVDPTLLLNKEQWDTFISEKKIMNRPFVLGYLLSDNPYHWIAIRKFTKKKGLDLRIIPKEGISYLYAQNDDYSMSIEDFLSLIAKAEYVITDSFHACVFSVIYHKKFIPIERFSSNSTSSQNSRIHDFLTGINCIDALETYNSKTIMYKDKAWDDVDYRIGEQIMRSKQFLRESIEL